MENTNYPLQEKIQAFVNGDLDASGRRTLLEQSATEPATADELAFSQSLALALRHRDLAAASAVLSGVIAEEGFPPPPPAGSAWARWSGWALGAALLLTLSLSGLWWAQREGWFLSASQQLSQAALQPLENVLYLPSTGQGLADLQTGMAAYDAGQYPAAARSLAAYVQQRPDATAQVYLGVALLLQNQAQPAIQPLADAAQSPEPPVQEAALWYLSLAYLATDQTEAARQTLRLVPADGIFGENARALLQKMPAK
jgi:hypothetical protein